MNRTDAFSLIEREREKQDEVWRKGTTERPVESQYVYAAPHIILLEEQVARLRANWYGVADESSLRERFVKVAAIAVRALEEIDVTR